MRNRSITHSVDSTFQALADPTRRALLSLLRSGSQPAGAIASEFSVSRPAISKHLQQLQRASLVRVRSEGRHRFYELNPEPLQAVDHWLDDYRVFWRSKLRRLQAFVQKDKAR